MITSRSGTRSFEGFIDRLIDIAENDSRQFDSLRALKVELEQSFVERDSKKYKEAFVRVRRALVGLYSVIIAPKDRKRFEQVAKNLESELICSLKEEYERGARGPGRREADIEKQRRGEESERLKLLTTRKDRVLSIRSSIGCEFIQECAVDHPIPITHSSNYNNWPMMRKFPFSSICHGMENLGNTCYVNSIIQALNTTSLKRFLLAKDLSKLPGRDAASVQLTCDFIKLLSCLNEPSRKVVSPMAFLRSLGEVYSPFKEYVQQDAHEFFNILLNGLNNGLNIAIGTSKPVQIDNSFGSDEELANKFMENYTKNNRSEIVKLFVFQERNAVKCPHCSQIYRSFNPCTGIEIPIPNWNRLCVEDCLEAYCREETLDESSLYACEKCKQKGRATQQLTFFSCPEILVITLKRFHRSSVSAEKVCSYVAFQPELDLSPFMCKRNQRAKYRLNAIVNHAGTLNGGHYTAMVREGNEMWSDCSDEHISECAGPRFDLAYILFYEKVKSSL